MEYWTCTICDIQIQTQSRDSHLSGNRHAMAAHSYREEFCLQRGAYLTERNNTTTSSSSTNANTLSANFGVAGITGDTIFATSDLTEVHSTSAVLVWQCTMCNCCIPLSVKQLHLSSLNHVQKLLENNQGHLHGDTTATSPGIQQRPWRKREIGLPGTVALISRATGLTQMIRMW
jgi:hypothetical protein